MTSSRRTHLTASSDSLKDNGKYQDPGTLRVLKHFEGEDNMIRLLIVAVIAAIGVVAGKDTIAARKNYEEGKEDAGKRFGELPGKSRKR